MKVEVIMPQKTKTVATLTLMAVMSLFIVGIAQSQEVTSEAKKEEGRGYFMFGGSILDIDGLNSRLESKGYSKFSDNLFSLGGGGHGMINRVIIGGEGHGLFGGEKESTISGETYKTSLTVGYGFFNMGYILYSMDDLNIYPILGIGGGGMSVKIAEREAPSFDEVLDNPRRISTLSSGGFLIKLALGADYLLKLAEDESGEGGLIFGLQIGYTFTPIKGDWQMGEIDVSGGPEVGITGPYIRFMIGGGGKSNK